MNEHKSPETSWWTQWNFSARNQSNGLLKVQQVPRHLGAPQMALLWYLAKINLFRQIAFVATVRRKKNIPIIPYSSLNPVRIVASCVVIIFPHQTASGRRGGSPMVDPGHRQGTMKGPTAFTEPLLRSRRIFFSWWMAKGIMLLT